MSDFFIAAGFLFLASAGILIWQWRAFRVSKEDRKTSALKAANRGPAALRDQLERERKERGLP